MKPVRSLYVVLSLLVVLIAAGANPDDKSSTSSGKTVKYLSWKTKAKSTDFKPALLKSMSASPTAQSAKSVRVRSTIDLKSGAFVPLNLVFKDADSCQKFEMEGIHLITRIDKYADVFATWDPSTQDIAPAVKQKLDADPDVISYEECAEPFLPPIPHVPPQPQLTRAPPDATALGGIGKSTGKGVIVAVIDSGIDFRHPDFIKTDANGKEVSRILYFWDTTSEQYKSGKLGKPAPYTYPNGAAIGTIFDNAELTGTLQVGRPPIPEWDTNGHGTACAGVAAGNGRGGPKDQKGKPIYTGVAPEADIIAVRIGTGETMENAYMLGAIIEWLQKVAGDRPLVVSCSFGGHAGGHDGYQADELQLDARFPLDAKGRAICIAAGNEGLDHFHADTQLGDQSNPGLLHWYSDSPTVMRVYLQASDPDDIDYDDTKSSGIVVRQDEKSGDNYLAIGKVIHPLTHQVILVALTEAGEGHLALFSKSGKTIAADAYFPEGSSEFDKDCCSARNMVGTPGTTTNAITVGSYDWNDRFDRWGEITSLPPVTSPRSAMQVGEMSSYSSPGYRRMGSAVKPEVTSPGQWYTAPAPLNVAADRDTTGLYQEFNGTSAATPYTAGCVALMFQKNPKLTLGEIKSLLQKSASTPPASSAHAGEIPNPFWGYGKLDRVAVQKALNAIP